MRKILRDLEKIEELRYTMENVCTDTKTTLNQWSDHQLVEEAEYVLSCFYEPGHIIHDDRFGDDKDLAKNLNKQIRLLKKFIKQYKTEDTAWTIHLEAMMSENSFGQSQIA